MTELVFKPKEGQVDFSNARWCPVINCVIFYDDRILLVKRNAGMRLYPSHWNGVSGFLDDQASLEEKVYEELREELGVGEAEVASIALVGIFDQEAPELQKTWIVHAVRVEVTTNKISLDWEAEDHIWISKDQVREYRLVPGFAEVVDAACKRGE